MGCGVSQCDPYLSVTPNCTTEFVSIGSHQHAVTAVVTAVINPSAFTEYCYC
jgi:hypothetical protein